jgi:glycerol-3-phosphate dehydrogenase (NAD(P)+)
MSKVAIIGAGSWGTTFSKVLADGGSHVMLWSRREEVATEINSSHQNESYLPGVNLPANIVASTDVEQVLAGAGQVYISVPSQSLRANLEAWGKFIPEDAIVVSLMKGVEQKTGLRMSQVIQECGIGSDRVVVVSGPNLALEIAAEQPAASVAASSSQASAMAVAKACTNSYFTTFTNNDVIGTEFGGILKNLIAVAIGIVNGVGYGQNTKASIMTRGLSEISRFASAFGAKPETMVGLAGLGDLIATSESPLSRNHKAGEMLGQGFSKKEVMEKLSQTAEALVSVSTVLELARAKNIAMPIVEQVELVIEGKMDPKDIAPHLTHMSDTPQGE